VVGEPQGSYLGPTQTILEPRADDKGRSSQDSPKTKWNTQTTMLGWEPLEGCSSRTISLELVCGSTVSRKGIGNTSSNKVCSQLFGHHFNYNSRFRERGDSSWEEEITAHPPPPPHSDCSGAAPTPKCWEEGQEAKGMRYPGNSL